jgi:hypothetical protein
MPAVLITPPLAVVPAPLLVMPPDVVAPAAPGLDPPLPVTVPAVLLETEPAVELGPPLELVPALPSDDGESSGEQAPVASKAADDR